MMPLLPENCEFNEEKDVLDMFFKPPKSPSLKDCVYFFFGEGGLYSQLEFTMVNRRADPIQEVLFQESPQRSFRGSRNREGVNYQFGGPQGFSVRVTTLGKTQLAHLAQFLGMGEGAFYKLGPSGTHGQVSYSSTLFSSLLSLWSYYCCWYSSKLISLF